MKHLPIFSGNPTVMTLRYRVLHVVLLEFIRTKMSGAEQKAESSAVMNFGRQLASSQKETRDKALRKVRKWLSSAPSGTFYVSHVPPCN